MPFKIRTHIIYISDRGVLVIFYKYNRYPSRRADSVGISRP